MFSVSAVDAQCSPNPIFLMEMPGKNEYFGISIVFSSKSFAFLNYRTTDPMENMNMGS